MKAINPATNELIKDYKEHSHSEVDSIIESSHNEYKKWRETSYADRRKLMLKAAAVLRKNRESYARTMSLEMGKIITEARAEVEKCAWICEYYAKNAEKFLQDELIETDASKSLVAYEPIGIVLAVMPWNFPFWQVFRFAAPALMAGNGGILKHASNVPGSALALAGGKGAGGFTLDANADKVVVTISDAAGQRVRQFDLGAVSAGVQRFDWDGKTDAGVVVTDGKFQIGITATIDGKAVQLDPLSSGKVTGVAPGSNGTQVQVAGLGLVDLSGIKQIN